MTVTRARTVGIPREIKDQESRVALSPPAVRSTVARGHTVIVEAGVGTGAGFADEDYEQAGAKLVSTAEEAWSADVVVKVKEPQPSEFTYFRDDLTLFTFLHLAAERPLAEALIDAHVNAYAYETLTEGHALPLLTPMSEIAGRAAAIIGASLLSAAHGGSGTLMGGAAGVPPAKTVVIGMGIAGTMAARGARGLGSHVTGIDVDLHRLFQHGLAGTVDATQVSEPALIADHVRAADLVVGAALVPGARAPMVIDEEMIATMRPGSVVVDLAIDQGGCIETSRPTSLSDPTYLAHGVVHYCVTNVPGQFPRTASAALSAAVAPRLLNLLDDPNHPSLEGALNVADGKLVHPVVAASFPDLAAVVTGRA